LSEFEGNEVSVDTVVTWVGPRRNDLWTSRKNSTWLKNQTSK